MYDPPLKNASYDIRWVMCESLVKKGKRRKNVHGLEYTCRSHALGFTPVILGTFPLVALVAINASTLSERSK